MLTHSILRALGSVEPLKLPHISSLDPNDTISFLAAQRGLRKRKRDSPHNDENQTYPFLFNTNSSEVASGGLEASQTVEIPMKHVQVPELAYPKSAYHGFEYPLPRCHEPAALEDILVSY